MTAPVLVSDPEVRLLGKIRFEDKCFTIEGRADLVEQLVRDHLRTYHTGRDDLNRFPAVSPLLAPPSPRMKVTLPSPGSPDYSAAVRLQAALDAQP